MLTAISGQLWTEQKLPAAPGETGLRFEPSAGSCTWKLKGKRTELKPSRRRRRTTFTRSAAAET